MLVVRVKGTCLRPGLGLSRGDFRDVSGLIVSACPSLQQQRVLCCNVPCLLGQIHRWGCCHRGAGGTNYLDLHITPSLLPRQAICHHQPTRGRSIAPRSHSSHDGWRAQIDRDTRRRTAVLARC